MRPGDLGAARVGENESTKQMLPFKNTRKFPNLVLYDIPEYGTIKYLSETFFMYASVFAS